MEEFDYSKLDKETLVKLLKMFSGCWMTVDGLWFLAVEEECGLDVAVKLDTKVYERYGYIEAKRIQETVGIAGGGVSAVVKALNFMVWIPTFKHDFPEISDKKAIFRITDCPPQRARIRDGRGECPCKPVDIAYFNSLANAIDPRVKVRCLCCPPDEHPEDVWCAWEFSTE